MERERPARRPMTKEQMLGVANYLTYSRIAGVPLLVFVMFGIHDADPSRLGMNLFFGWLGAALVTLAGISDAVDGYYARKYGVVSSFGKFLDPLADKILSMSVFVMLVHLGRLDAWMAILLIARDITINGIRSMAADEGIVISASIWGKRKTVFTNIALGFLLVHTPYFGIDAHAIGVGLIWISLVISIGSGIHYVWSFFSAILERKKKN